MLPQKISLNKSNLVKYIVRIETKLQNFIEVPYCVVADFILDHEDVDRMSPWQPHLIEGHTFPHHILRIWYSYLDVPMDTASLEDMYKTLCLLHAGRQTQVELQQVRSRSFEPRHEKNVA